MKKKLLLLFFFFLAVSAFPQADIVVTNSDFSATYVPDENSTYTVTVTNLGPNAATNVHVTNAIPAGVEYFSWWGSNGSSGIYEPLDNTIANLAVGQTVTYTIVIEVPASYLGPLTSETIVTSATADPNPACAQCIDTNVRALGADVQIVNTDNQAQYAPGETLTYTMTVTNNGPLTAANVIVSNPIPAGITVFSWSGNGGSGTNVPLTNTIPALTAGQSVVYTITLEVPPGFTGNLTNTASWTTPTIDPVPGCPQCTDVDTQGSGADLQIVNTDDQTTYQSGTTNTYTVTVTNNGPAVATNVQVSNAIPAGIPAANFSWSGDNGSSGTGAALSDTLPTLAVGQSVVYTITVDIPAAMTAPLTTETIVTSTTIDPTPACPDCIDTDTHVSGADIVVVNTDNNATYVQGSNNIYTITVTNNGPEDAANVHVTNAIPAGITAFSWSGTNGSTGTNANLDDTIPLLAAGTTVTYTITLGVPAGYTGPLTSTANVTSTTADPNPGCTQCVDTDTQAVAGADIVVMKTDNSPTFTPGTQAVYTITITNNGPEAAQAVNVQDAVPAGIPAANVSWTGPNGTGTGAINENFATVNVGQTLTYTVSVNVPADFDQQTDLVNTVAVTSTTTDPNPVCAGCTDTDSPWPLANLSVTKSDSKATYLNNSEVTYSITIVNLGPSNAVNIEVNDPLPAQITSMVWEGSNGSSGTGALQDVIADLPVGAIVTYQVTIDVPANYDLTHINLTNTVAVTSDTLDPQPACPGCSDVDNAAPNWVTIHTNLFTLQELVEDVLIHSECANVSNFSSQGYVSNTSGANATSCVGYFHHNNSDFPIKDGVVIGTAQVVGFQGQYSGGNDLAGSGAGDAQLLQVSNANGGSSSINDAAYVQFDFTPLTDEFSFEFLFASEEYGPFQCTFGDVFAFLLTDLSAPLVPGVNPLNVAVIPNVTPPTAVSVLTVRDDAYNGGCASVNDNWYGIHNAAFPALSAVNIRGQLKPMTAKATVIPNHNYRIKLAIGDYQDSIVNSAVFLEAGSFNVGQTDLYDSTSTQYDEDNPDLVGPYAGCPGESFVIQAGSSAIAGATYQWFLNDLPLAGETNYQLTLDEPGVYSVIVSIGGGCQQTDSITVEYLPDMPLGNPTELLFCEGQTVNLTDINPQILGSLSPLQYEIHYHANQQDALDVANLLSPETTYPGTNGQTIYASIQDLLGSGCIGVRSFMLTTYPCGNPVTPPDMYECDTSAFGIGQESFDISGIPGIALGANNAADYTITVHLSQADADADTGAIDTTIPFIGTDSQQLFIRMETVTDPTVYETTFFTLHLNAVPAAPVVPDVTACNSYTLPNLPAGQFYNTASGGTGSDVAAGTSITTTTVLYAIAESGTTPNCISEDSFTITINQTPPAPSVPDVTACDNYVLPVLPAGQYYNTASGGTGTTIAASTPINTTTTLFVIAESGTTPNCISEDSFTITINGTPPVPTTPDVTVCDSYTLPVLPAGQYYNTASGGTGTTIAGGSTVNATTTLYVIAESGTTPNCASEDVFTITVNQTPPVPTTPDVTACDSYTLPILPAGQYYNTASGGTGTTIAGGTTVNTTTTLYVIAESGTTPNCASEDVFTITINPTPAVPTTPDVTACDSYTLPILPAGQYYNTASGGTGTTIAGGTSITATTTLYVIAESGGTPNCTSEDVFTITINQTPPVPATPDVTACDSYTLPILPAGQYYNTASGGTGTTIAGGTTVNTTTTLYVIAESGTTPNCASEDVFTITINQTPPVPTTPDVAVCDSYTLPILPAGQYYNTASGGTGTTIAGGTPITATTTLYVIAESGTTPNCSSEDEFTITIYETPVIDNPADVTVCEQYVLPVLTVGNYYTGPNGTGTMIPGGTPITTSQLVYIYAESATTPNCPVENSFQVTIVYPPVAVSPSDIRLCDDNNDGYQCFDLTAAALQATGGNASLSAAFYLTLTDAQVGGSAAAIGNLSSYCTIDPWHQTLYVRVFEASAPGCASVAQLELYVDPSPVALESIPAFGLCDADAFPGTEAFDLPSHLPFIVADATGLSASFHHSQADALSGAGAIASPYTSAGETVWVRLSTGAGCVDVAPFDLVVWPLPAVAAPLAPRAECAGAGGLASFDLASYIPSISQGVPGVSVSFYASQADAQAPQSPLASPYQTAGGTVWVRLDNEHCFALAELQLVAESGPAVSAPQPLVACDDNNDCFATFDLTQAEQGIWGSPVPGGVSFAYYLTQTDAEQQSAQNQIGSPGAYANIDPCAQTVWVAVTAPGGSCPSVVPLQLQVNPRPVANESLAPLRVCDADGDGQAWFVLSDPALQASILAGMGPAGYQVEFFASMADLAAGNAITGTASYLSPTATVYVSVTDLATGCADVVELSLEVLAQPAIADIPPYRLCDDGFDQQASFDLAGYVGPLLGPGLSASFHHTQADAIAGTGGLSSPHVNDGPTAAAEFIWVRIENAEGCFAVKGMDIVVDPLPQPLLPAADYPRLFACDDNNDCHAAFDLAAIAAYMQQGALPGQMQLTFHATESDAQAGANAIPATASYQNNEPCLETLWVAAVNPSTAGQCRSVWPITLTVNPAAVADPQPALQACAAGQSGFATFDLTQVEAAVLAAQAGAGPYAVSYYTSQAAALAGTGAIGSPWAFQNTVAFSQQIWFRVDQPGDCDDVDSFMLQVDSPLALPSSLGLFTQCADPALGQFVPWDLTQIAIPGMGPGYQAHYFPSLAQAQSGAGEIADPSSYVNVDEAQTIGILVEDLATGCASYTIATLQVLPLPMPRPWQAGQNQLTACEQGNSGTAEFDLSQFEAWLANGDPNMHFSYHESLADAEAGTGAIADPAQYASAGGTAYVRVEERPAQDSQGQYCHVVLEISLAMNPQPALLPGQSLVGCEYPAGAGVHTFDLNDIQQQLLAAGQDPSGFSFAFADASGPIPAAAASSYQNQSSPQQISVTVTDLATGCASVGSFELSVKAGAGAAPYAFAPACDAYNDITDGIALFDLTQADAAVLAGQPAGQFSVAYFASLADAQAGTSPIAPAGAYESASATLYAVVSNLGTGASPDPAPCRSEPVAVTLSVEAAPAASITGGQTICVDWATLAATPAVLSASPSGAGYTYQWYVDGVLEAALSGDTVSVTEPGSYTVVVSSASGCASAPSAAHAVVESSAPESLSYTVSGAFQDSQSIQVSVQGVNPQAFEYSMDGGPWLANGGLFENVGPGEHAVSVRSACGQAGPIVVQLINYPHFFTPNGDGINDVWNTIGIANDGRTKIYIFDRYGKLIKQIAPSADRSTGWDGTYNGYLMPSTDYWFTIEYPDPNTGAMKEFKAHFSLKR